MLTKEQAIEIARGKVHDVCLDPTRSPHRDAWVFQDMWVILVVTDAGDYFFV